MKLLIVTQAVDTEDPVLGFFVAWIRAFAAHADSVEIIALRVGTSDVPTNVRVHSLGKERHATENTIIYDSVLRRARYAWRFVVLVWQLRGQYDAVFVHMNEEYVLVAGWLWRLLGKRIYLWRNHNAGSWRTDLAAAFCTVVFCTSRHSYTAKYKKTILMPVGIDTEVFKPDARESRVPRSILFVARMAPSKRPEMLLDALKQLIELGEEFTATFVGSPVPRDDAWYRALRERARSLGSRVTFVPAVVNAKTPALYRTHQIFVNCSRSGMFDKTLFEAAACGCRVLAASDDFAALSGEESHFDSAGELAAKLRTAFSAPAVNVSTFVRENSLDALATRLAKELTRGYAT